MGVSTDAILFWGAHHEEDEEWPFDIYEAEEYILDRLGIVRPDVEYNANSPEILKQYADYWYRKGEALKKFGIAVGTHCSDQCPMPYVYVSESKTVAWRGDAKPITSLEVKPEWGVKLRRFYELIGKPYPDSVGWWLVSYWG